MSEEINHEYTDEAVCPHCGAEQIDSWELDDGGTYECGECDKEFTVSCHHSITYSTKKTL